MIDISPNQAQQAFLAGSIGIISDSSSFLATLSNGAAGRFAVGAAPYPLTRDVGRLPPGGNCATVAAKDIDRQKAAWTFVRYAVGPTAQYLLAKQSGYLPVNNLAAERLAAEQTNPVERANSSVAAGMLSHLTEWYGFPPPNAPKIVNAIQVRIQSLISKVASPGEAMRGMASDVQALLPRGAKRT